MYMLIYNSLCDCCVRWRVFLFSFSVPSSAEEQTQKKIGETEKLKITGRDLFQFDQHTHRERERVLFCLSFFWLRTRVWMSCDYRKSFSLSLSLKKKTLFCLNLCVKFRAFPRISCHPHFNSAPHQKYFFGCCWISPIVCAVCLLFCPPYWILSDLLPPRYNSKTTNGWLLPLFSRRIARIVQHTQLDDDMMTRPLYDTKRSARSPTHRHTIQRTYVFFFVLPYSFLFL